MRGKSPTALCLACLACLGGCRQQMASQPAYRPLTPSNFFADGRSSRPLVAGTVPRGHLREDDHLFTGRRARPEPDAKASGGKEGKANGRGNEGPEAYVDAFPLPITYEYPKYGDETKQLSVLRGQERFNVFCAPCHDRAGTGKGIVALRGFTPPPSLHTDLSRGFKLRGREVPLKDAPVGYYFDVITNGFGAMPQYSHQIPAHDRWAIIAYVRALQVSQGAVGKKDADGKQGAKP